MSGVFSRSWELTKLSFRVLMQDKEMLLFPFLGGLFSLLFSLALLYPPSSLACSSVGRKPKSTSSDMC